MLQPADLGASAIREEESVRQQLSTGLLKIGMAIRHHAWAGGEQAGLTPTQGQMLALILQRGDRETRLNDLARDLAVTQATASVALRTLVDKGLVTKARSGTDARAVAITLTGAGRDLASRSLEWTDFLLDAVDELDPQDQAVFQRSLVKMIRSMQEKGQIPVARMCVSCRYFRPNAHPGDVNAHHCAYVDAAFGDRHLRLDCADFEPATTANAERAWASFAGTGVHAAANRGEP